MDKLITSPSISVLESLLLYLRFSGENARRTARFKCSNARVGNQDVTDKTGQNTIVLSSETVDFLGKTLFF